MEEIKRRAEAGERRLTLVVPEQYSHDAERQLLRIVGDRLSLHGEALSFKRLAARVAEETGGARPVLDPGGALLVMYRAVGAVSDKLESYGGAERRSNFAEALLQTVTELKNSAVTPGALQAAAARSGGALGKKLRDLSLIMAAFDAQMEQSGALDSCAMLRRLSETAGKSSYASAVFYFDGFNDFTEPETRVISALIRSGAETAFCLTVPDLHGGEDVFGVVRDAADELIRCALEAGEKYEVVTLSGGGRGFNTELMEAAVFGYGGGRGEGLSGVELYAAPDAVTECEYAAAIAVSLARGGYRWGDIAVMSRGGGEYPKLCESVFERRGIPVFRGGRDGALEKPPVRLIVKALDAVSSGWEYEDVFAYLKTGLAGVLRDDIDALESIAIRRGIRGRNAWTGDMPWGEETDKALDAARLAAAAPLAELDRALSASASGGDMLRALYAFLERIKLPESLASRSASLGEAGYKRLASEYSQLWELITEALDQMYIVLENASVTARELSRLFSLLASRRDVGVIPVSLDRVTIGDMAMNRRRDIKALIVIGAADANMPSLPGMTGVLSGAERDELNEKLGVPLRDNSERLLRREMNVIYSALALPSEKLVVIYPESAGSRPSFVAERLRAALGTVPGRLREADFIQPPPRARREDARRAGLSENAAARLYGKTVRLSATRVEKLFTCKFAFFMQNGLRARPRVPERFDAARAGAFTHFVLERAADAASALGGFKNVPEDDVRRLARRFAREYIDLNYPENGSGTARLRYLLSRLSADLERVTLDLKGELERSDFEPLAFESEFRAAIADGELEISGIIDRVDGWENGGKLYIRVSDYKTGRKTFSLSDVCCGINLQMLIYVYALGGARLGERETIPAGILYTPARDELYQADRNVGDGVIAAALAKAKRRRGLILGEAELIDAMERGPDKRYLPVREKDGIYTGDSLVTRGQMESLLLYVENKLRRAARELRSGDISSSPCSKGDSDNVCLYCEFKAACLFGAFPGDKARPMPPVTNKEFWARAEGGGEG
ncbi:MAG: PD-(D/E)XK nuclease family protein [Oscillospiraceae bacterium]|jgi:ATP-dependent helicase/nuclease subunit B|nr:PD-(D/E)XK nuclease family protein [Oscillospiraceae bacterium]